MEKKPWKERKDKKKAGQKKDDGHIIESNKYKRQKLRLDLALSKKVMQQSQTLNRLKNYFVPLWNC